jgi:hypothetical protein
VVRLWQALGYLECNRNFSTESLVLALDSVHAHVKPSMNRTLRNFIHASTTQVQQHLSETIPFFGQGFCVCSARLVVVVYIGQSRVKVSEAGCEYGLREKRKPKWKQTSSITHCHSRASDNTLTFTSKHTKFHLLKGIAKNNNKGPVKCSSYNFFPV